MGSTSSSVPASDSYEQFFGFAQAPFTLTPDPRFLYRSTSHEDAITLLLQALRRKEGFIVLTGDIGTGKTTISRALIQQLDANTFTSLLLNPFVTIDELLQEALLDFGVISREALRNGRVAHASTHELVRTLQEFLLSLVAINGKAVLIVDEAQHLSPHVLEQIRVLSNLETNESKLLQIVLVGQLNLLDLLAQADMRQLQQRVSLLATLKPLTREEVEAYVGHRLAVASGTAGATFQSDALDRVFAQSGGVPRVINLLCDGALRAAAASGESAIAARHVRQAAGRLSLQTPPAATAVRAHAGRRRWAVALAVLLVLVAGAAALVIVRPLETWVDAPLPALPASPPPRVATGAAAMPLPEDGGQTPSQRDSGV